MTINPGSNQIANGTGKVYVGASAVDKLYAGTNLVWQKADTTAPSQPPSFTASASGTTASLAWGASTDDVGVTGYKVYRGGTLLTTTTARTYSDSGLGYSTSYAWQVSAIDAAGNESTKASASATTGAAPSGGGGGGGGTTVTYPRTVGTFSYNDRPFNGHDSQGSWTQPGTYNLGSLNLTGEQYQVSTYFYADSSEPFGTDLYANGFVSAYTSGIGGSGEMSTGTSDGGARYTSGTFRATGFYSWSLVVTDSFYCGPGGSPMLTVTAVGP